jgi:hypothetical protein
MSFFSLQFFPNDHYPVKKEKIEKRTLEKLKKLTINKRPMTSLWAPICVLTLNCNEKLTDT